MGFCTVRILCGFVGLFLDKSSLVTPWMEWIGCFIKAASLLVDALVSVHDERTGAVRTGLSRQRAGTLCFVEHISKIMIKIDVL